MRTSKIKKTEHINKYLHNRKEIYIDKTSANPHNNLKSVLMRPQQMQASKQPKSIATLYMLTLRLHKLDDLQCNRSIYLATEQNFIVLLGPHQGHIKQKQILFAQ